jgi:hypothetical protein
MRAVSSMRIVLSTEAGWIRGLVDSRKWLDSAPLHGLASNYDY